MTTDLGLTDYEWNMDGFDFGQAAAGDHYVDVMKVEGLNSLGTRRSDRPFVGQDGYMPGIHLADRKVVELELQVRKSGQTDTQWRDKIREVENAFSTSRVNDVELHWQFPGEAERFIRCRPIRRRRTIEPDTETGLAPIVVQVQATDPRIYVAAPRSDNNNSGTSNVTNNGEINAYPKITFLRGVASTRCRITNNTTGQVLDIDGLPSATTDVIADMDRYIRGSSELIIYIGSTNHYGDWVIPRTPFYLAPGTNSITVNNGGNVNFEWWDAEL